VALVFVALVFLGLAFLAPPAGAAVLCAGTFFAVPVFVGLALAVVVLVAAAALCAVLRAGGVVAADSPRVVRRFDGDAVFFAPVALPVAPFADVAERPAMATALCPEVRAAAPLHAVRPD
jgi:hypothetical protein